MAFDQAHGLLTPCLMAIRVKAISRVSSCPPLHSNSSLMLLNPVEASIWPPRALQVTGDDDVWIDILSLS
jgi:hypothetical protein